MAAFTVISAEKHASQLGMFQLTENLDPFPIFWCFFPPSVCLEEIFIYHLFIRIIKLEIRGILYH